MKWLLIALSSVKLGKVLLSGGTMLLSMFAYALVFGWPYAVGFVLLIFVHEMGHYLAARQRNLAVGLPAFIPFVGAWVALKEQPLDVETEAYIGLAGPFVGSVASLACYLLARHFGSQLLLALSFSGLMLNLFNLLPLSPLDGGRITAAVSPRIWLLGVPMLAALFLYRPSPVLLLVALLALPQLVAAWRGRPPEGRDESYYNLSTALRLQYGIAYLGLAGLLGAMSYEVHGMLQPGAQ